MLSVALVGRGTSQLRSLTLANLLGNAGEFLVSTCPVSYHHQLAVGLSVLGHRPLSYRWYSDDKSSRKQRDHINFDTLGTWDNRIELPLQLSESIKHGKPIPKISLSNVGTATNIGRRTTNEDRLSVKELSPDLLYFAVFDGHGGPACADFCNTYTHDHIVNWLQKGERDLKTILELVFSELDNAFSRFIAYSGQGKEGPTPGTTATVCLLRNSIELVVGHVGDSRAILCRNGDAHKLTTDHSPSLKAEKERIEKSGGHVICNSIGQLLVNGRLAMTRSLGDLELKPYGVICQPDTLSMEVQHGKDAFVILTTDGINSVTSDQEICDTVNQCQEPEEAANFIVDQALQYASDDNTTAVVVPFGSWGKFGTKTSHHSFGRNMIKSARFS